MCGSANSLNLVLFNDARCLAFYDPAREDTEYNTGSWKLNSIAIAHHNYDSDGDEHSILYFAKALDESSSMVAKCDLNFLEKAFRKILNETDLPLEGILAGLAVVYESGKADKLVVDMLIDFSDEIGPATQIGIIPIPAAQYRCAQSRIPIEMIRHG